MPNKREITQAVVKSLGADTHWTVDQAMLAWWRNLRDGGGLQLSMIGYWVFLEQAQLECHEFEIAADLLNGRNLIVLDQKMTTPYALVRVRGSHMRLVMFGSREAMMATLYGDVQAWINSLNPQ